MAFDETILLDGVNVKVWGFTYVDADDVLTIAHELPEAPAWVDLQPLGQVASALAEWALVSVSDTEIVCEKATDVGSGAGSLKVMAILENTPKFG